MTQLEQAEQIARQAHAGQVDKHGEDYIHHVERVVARVDDDDAKAVAWLHDVLEDNRRWTSAELLSHGISPHVVDAVVILTKGVHEPYDRYIHRVVVSGNQMAITVKIADLYDHLSDRCPDHLRPRYEQALAVILKA